MPSRQSASKSPSGASRPPAASTADRQGAARLSALLLGRRGGSVRFTVSSDTGETVDLSPSLLTILEAAAGMVADGAGVAVLAEDQELTSQQAADLLNVSRQYLVRLLERGDIPSTKVGAHRRVRAADLVRYCERRDEGRRAALAEMADQGQAGGAYDAPPAFGPRRRG
jgi:excisionase family DNA binding protein